MIARRPSRGRRVVSLLLAVIFLGIVILFGYTLGKDMALRDNARDARAEGVR